MNNRRWALFLVLFLFFDLVVFGVIGWWFFLRREAAATSAVFELLPEETIAAIHIPDWTRSGERWQETALNKIWAEPELQAFLQKPLESIPEMPSEVDETWADLNAIAPKDLFVALTRIDPAPAVIAGFRSAMPSAELDSRLAKWETRIKEAAPTGNSGVETHGEVTIRTFTDGKNTIAMAAVDDWRIWGNDLPAVKTAIDHLKGKGEAGKGLAASERFKTVKAKLGTDAYDGVAFLDITTVRDRFLQMIAASGAQQNEKALAEFKKMQALGFAFRMDGPLMRERGYALMPGFEKPGDTFKNESLKFTTPETLLYYGGGFQTGNLFDPKTWEPLVQQSAEVEPVARLIKAFNDAGLDDEAMEKVFGPELSVQLDWGKNQMQPKAFVRLGVRDEAKATQAFQLVVDGASTGIAWNTRDSKDIPGLKLHTYPGRTGFGQPVPTLAISSAGMVFGLSPRDVEQFYKRASSENTLANSESFKQSKDLVAPANLAFAFLDTRGMFEKAYSALRSTLTMLSMFSKEMSEQFPISKLPKTETIAKHLTPLVMSYSMDEEGILLESAGPVTVLQAATGLGIVGGVGVAVAARMQQSAPFDLPLETNDTPETSTQE